MLFKPEASLRLCCSLNTEEAWKACSAIQTADSWANFAEGLGQSRREHSSIDVRHNHRFKNRDAQEFNRIFLNLPYRLRGLKFHCWRTISRNERPPSADHRKTKTPGCAHFHFVRGMRVSVLPSLPK